MYDITEEPTLVTNFTKDRLAQYKGAIVIYQITENIHTLRLEKKAYDVHNRLLENHHSLHISQSHDLSKFWKIFDSLGQCLTV